MLRANELGLFGQFFPPAVSSRLPLGHVAWPVPQQCHSLLFSLAQKYTFPQYEPKMPAFFARHPPRLKNATSPREWVIRKGWGMGTNKKTDPTA